MSFSDSSTSLRAHVDATLDPVYERLFAVLDLIVVAKSRSRPDIARILELREALGTQIAALDRHDRTEVTGPA